MQVWVTHVDLQQTMAGKICNRQKMGRGGRTDNDNETIQWELRKKQPSARDVFPIPASRDVTGQCDRATRVYV